MTTLVILKEKNPDEMRVRSCCRQLQYMYVTMHMYVHIFQGVLDYLMKLIDNIMSNEVKVSYTCALKRNKVQSLVKSPENVLDNLTPTICKMLEVEDHMK